MTTMHLSGDNQSSSTTLQSNLSGTTLVSATSVTPSGGTGAVTLIARSAQSEAEKDSVTSKARYFQSCVETGGNPCEAEAFQKGL